MREKGSVFEWGECALEIEDLSQLNYAFDSVLITNAKSIAFEWKGKNDIFQDRPYSSGAIGLRSASFRAKIQSSINSA